MRFLLLLLQLFSEFFLLCIESLVSLLEELDLLLKKRFLFQKVTFRGHLLPLSLFLRVFG